MIVAGSGGNAATCLGCQLVEEIILIIHGREVVLSSGLASEGFAVADLLKVVQTAGDTLFRPQAIPLLPLLLKAYRLMLALP